MIAVDCTDIESKKLELVVYVSDVIQAIPTMKNHGFVLSPINDDKIIDKNKVVTAIKDYLESVGEGTNFAVISDGEGLVIKSLFTKTDEKKSQQSSEAFFSCTHCGFSTRFEGELNIHQKIHYL